MQETISSNEPGEYNAGEHLNEFHLSPEQKEGYTEMLAYLSLGDLDAALKISQHFKLPAEIQKSAEFLDMAKEL